MITDVFDLRRTAESGFFPIPQYFLEQMPVLGFLGRGVNQAWICRRVLWLELFDRFKIGRVGHDFGKLFQLLQLIQFCSDLLLLKDSAAHDNSSLFDLIQNVRLNKRTTTTNSMRLRNCGQHFRSDSKRPNSSEQTRTLPNAPQSFAANQSQREQNCSQVPTLDPEICD